MIEEDPTLKRRYSLIKNYGEQKARCQSNADSYYTIQFLKFEIVDRSTIATS